MIFNKYFYRNIWNTEEDLLANYKNTYKENLSIFTVKSFPNQEIVGNNKAQKFWLLSEQYDDAEAQLWDYMQRERIEEEILKWKANYLASDVFTSFHEISFTQLSGGELK